MAGRATNILAKNGPFEAIWRGQSKMLTYEFEPLGKQGGVCDDPA